jgi:hypothetical protein
MPNWLNSNKMLLPLAAAHPPLPPEGLALPPVRPAVHPPAVRQALQRALALFAQVEEVDMVRRVVLVSPPRRLELLC